MPPRSPECALMETVFHDIPLQPGFKSYDKDNLAQLIGVDIR
jgi:hypothetical protein